MHQFWAVQRLTQEDLQKKIANEPQSRLPAGFNVTTVITDHDVVSIGKLNEKSVSLTLQVQVPMMTNEATIRKGEQLVMEHIAAAVARKRKETSWKNEYSAAKAKAKAEPKSKPRGDGGLTVGEVWESETRARVATAPRSCGAPLRPNVPLRNGGAGLLGVLQLL